MRESCLGRLCVTRRLIAACACALALYGTCWPAVAARNEQTRRVTLEGQVFDREGRPLPGLTVSVLEFGSGSPLDALRRELDEREVMRAETDAAGLYRFDVEVPPGSGRLVVRCYDRESWDHLRYDVPLDVDVTGEARDRGRAIVNFRVEDAPVWTEIVHAVERFGGRSSERGRILRRHGMPPEVLARLDGPVEWRYPNVTYVFERGVLVRTIEDGGSAADAGEQAAR